MLAIRFTFDALVPGESPDLAPGHIVFQGDGGISSSADPPRRIILIDSVAAFLDAVVSLLSIRSRRAVEFTAIGDLFGLILRKYARIEIIALVPLGDRLPTHLATPAELIAAAEQATTDLLAGRKPTQVAEQTECRDLADALHAFRRLAADLRP